MEMIEHKCISWGISVMGNCTFLKWLWGTKDINQGSSKVCMDKCWPSWLSLSAALLTSRIFLERYIMHARDIINKNLASWSLQRFFMMDSPTRFAKMTTLSRKDYLRLQWILGSSNLRRAVLAWHTNPCSLLSFLSLYSTLCDLVTWLC